MMMMIRIIIRIQEISIEHNPRLKARAQCAHRKTQKKYLKNKEKNRAHHDYHTMDNHTICGGEREGGMQVQNNSQKKKVESSEITNCPKRTQAHY